MKIVLYESIQKLFNLFGLQIRRLDPGVRLDSALEEQLRLAGPSIGCIFEVGAADGRDTAIYAARCPNAQVFAFEPVPESFEKLATVSEHRPQIRPHQLAMSKSAGVAEFYITSNTDSSSLLEPEISGGILDKYLLVKKTIQVTVTTLSDFCESNHIKNIDILKIDAQGMELDIFKGGEYLFRNGLVNVIYCEIQFEEIYKQSALFHEIVEYLIGFGYRIHNIYDFSHDKSGKLMWADAIFVRSSHG